MAILKLRLSHLRLTLRGRKTCSAGSGRRVTDPSRVTGGRGRVVAFLVLIAAADRRLERIEKAIKKLNGLDARRDTLEAAVEAADRAEEMARDLEYEIVSSAPDGEQLADDYEELGGGRCAVM